MLQSQALSEFNLAQEKKRGRIIKRVKLVLVLLTISSSVVVLFCTLFTTLGTSHSPRVFPVLQLGRFWQYGKTNASKPANVSRITIYDELLVSNFTDVEMTSPDRSERRIYDESNEPVEDANPLRYVYVLGRRKGRKVPETDNDDHSVNRVLHGTPFYPSGLYGYSTAPVFSDAYAQLEAYRHQNRIKSIQDVMKYIKDDRKQTPTVKFAGVYMKTPDNLDDQEIMDQATAFTRPFLNGHAYVADPFIKYKPSHPSEVNQLVAASEDVDLMPSRLRPTLRPARPIAQVLSPVATTHTQAIFHPLDPPMLTYPFTNFRDTKPSEKKPKPFSVMLDIYPVAYDAPDQGEKGAEFRPVIALRPTPRPPRGNRMVVRLNLYPKKTSRRRPGSTGMLHHGAGLQGRSFEDGAGEVLLKEKGQDNELAGKKSNASNQSKQEVSDCIMTGSERLEAPATPPVEIEQTTITEPNQTEPSTSSNV